MIHVSKILSLLLSTDRVEPSKMKRNKAKNVKDSAAFFLHFKQSR
jgi:hypothetical protein